MKNDAWYTMLTMEGYKAVMLSPLVDEDYKVIINMILEGYDLHEISIALQCSDQQLDRKIFDLKWIIFEELGKDIWDEFRQDLLDRVNFATDFWCSQLYHSPVSNHKYLELGCDSCAG